VASRSLFFDIFANDRASSAFTRLSAHAEILANRITRLDGKRAKVTVAADTSGLERKLAKAEADLERLNRMRADPRIDANITLAQGKLVELATQLQELNKKRIRPEVQVKIGDAQARIAGLERQLEALSRRQVSPVVTMQSAIIRSQIAAIRREIDGLNRSGADPKVTLDISRAQAQIVILRERIAELGRQRSSPTVDANIAAAEAKLAMLRAQLDRMRNERVEVKVDVDGGRGFGSILSTLNDMRHGFVSATNSVAMFMRSLRQVAVLPGLAAIAPTLLGIGSAAQTAGQTVALLPGIIATVGIAFGALKMAFTDFKDLFAVLDTAGKKKKFNAAMAQAAEDVRNLVLQVRALGPAWNSVRVELQMRMFRDLSLTVKQLSERYIPLMKQGFSGVGDSFNQMFRSLGDFFLLPERIEDVNRLFSFTSQMVANLVPGVRNVVAAFMDMAVVGGSFMPGLANSFSEVTGRFREFIATARADGSLQLWIAKGIAQLKEFGGLISNVGGMFGGLFDAADKSGQGVITTMRLATAELEKMIKSSQGQAGFIALFQGIHEAVQSVMPGIKALFSSVAEGIVTLRPSISAVGNAFSSLAIAVAPTFEILATMASYVIPALAAAFSGVASTLGGVVPMIIAFGVAFKGLTMVSAILVGIAAAAVRAGEALGMMALAFGASGAAAQRFATAGAVISRALTQVAYLLPGIGIAVLAAVVAFDTLGSKATENADKIVKGSMTIAQAVAEEVHHIQAVEQATIAYGNAVSGIEPDVMAAATTADAHAEAQRRVTEATEAQIQKLPIMEQLQARVTIAENAFQDALARGDTAAAAVAQEQLRTAKENLSTATDRNTEAAKTNTEAWIENANQAASAANADVAAERAALNLIKARERVSEVLKTNTADSVAGRTALNDLQAAHLQVAESARRQAEEHAKANGATNAAEIGAQAYRDKLAELAQQADGPTKAALLTMITNLDNTRAAKDRTAAASEIYRTRLADLSNTSNGQFRPAIQAATQALDVISRSHMTSEQKAAAQKAELLRLAGILPEPVRGEIMRLIADMNRIPPEKRFKISAQGELTALTSHISQGGKTVATGGILDGYTPGRDVHNFISPTGGMLSLSGGEAVMRPEWTRAMGSDYVNRANAAARIGGMTGVQEFVRNTSIPGEYFRGGVLSHHKYANGGIFGQMPRQSFAGGGFVQTGSTPIMTLPSRQAANLERAMLAALVARFKEEQKKFMASFGGLGGGVVAGAVGAMMAVLRSAFPGLRLISGFRPGAITATGNRSYHSMGRAVDVPPSMAVFNWIRSNFGGRTRELIFSPAGGAQVHNGRPHMYTGITRAMHFDHVHWAMKNGGIMPNFDRGGMAFGRGGMLKKTIAPERVLSDRQTIAFEDMVSNMDRSSGVSYGGSPDVVAAIQNLGRQLVAVNGRVGAIETHFNNTFMVSGSASQIASAVGQRQRTEAELGGFRGR
jgi:hypothetical protein